MAIDIAQIVALRQAEQQRRGMPLTQMPGMPSPGGNAGAAGRRMQGMEMQMNPNAQLDGSQVELGPGMGGNPLPSMTDSFGNPQVGTDGQWLPPGANPQAQFGEDGTGMTDPTTGGTQGPPLNVPNLEGMNQSATAQMGPQPAISQEHINTMIKYGILFGMLGGGGMGAPANGGQ